MMTIAPPPKTWVKKDKMATFVDKLKKMPDVRPHVQRKEYPKDLEAHLYSVVADKVLEEMKKV